MDWYYVKSGQRLGPVPGAELKRLADTGGLDREDLVWREGMSDWIAARKVRGLFDSPTPSSKTASTTDATDAESSSPRTESGSSTGDGPIPPATEPPTAAADPPSVEPISLEEIKIETKRRKRKPSEPSSTQASATTDPATDVPTSSAGGAPVSPTSPPVMGASVGLGHAETRPEANAAPASPAPPPAGQGRASRQPKPPSGPPRHLFDFVLSGLRRAIRPAFIESAGRLFLVLGHYGTYVVMLLALLYGAALGVRASDLGTTAALIPPAIGLGLATGFFVLQYAATRFCRALDTLNESSPGRMSSTAFLDCFALVAIAGGVAMTASVAIAGLLRGSPTMITTALAVFVLGEFMAAVALCPEAVRISIAEEATAGEEAIGILAFAVKLIGRTAVAAYGAMMVVAIFATLSAIVMVFADASWFADRMPFESLIPAFQAALAPILAYILMLFGFLFIDVIRAVLSVARRPFEVCLPREETNDEKSESD